MHRSLDGKNLKKLGFTAAKVQSDVDLPDALFFHQLIFSMCDTSKSGVEDDGKLSFYDDMQMFSALYQISNKIRAAYGHKLPLPTVDGFVNVDGVVARGSIYGRSEGAIY